MTKIKIQLWSIVESLMVVIIGAILNHYIPSLSIYEFVLISILVKLYSFSNQTTHYLRSIVSIK